MSAGLPPCKVPLSPLANSGLLTLPCPLALQEGVQGAWLHAALLHQRARLRSHVPRLRE